MEKRVTGIGGIFFKSASPKNLREWYARHLGIPVEDWGGWVFKWGTQNSTEPEGSTIWNPFKSDSDYFNPSEKEFMINYRVENLDALIQILKEEGVTVVGGPIEEGFGKFAWILDPEGNKIELWEPPKTIP